LTRHRTRLVRGQAQAKIKLRGMLARLNREAPYKHPFGPRGLAWFHAQDFGPTENLIRDELLLRLSHFARHVAVVDQWLAELQREFPEVESLLDIHGIGPYSALVIIGELGEVERFHRANQVGAYAGLATRVHQSGEHCHHGAITREGSPLLRWVLVEVALHVTGADPALKNFYTRVRKRSSAKRARVAVARKLAEICWKRLRNWHRRHPRPAA
jgi:transposase